MKRMKIVTIAAAVIAAVVLMTFPRGSSTVESQPGCPASGSVFQVDYFGLPLKDYWKCQIPGNQSVTIHKADSIVNLLVDAAVGLIIVLVPAFYFSGRGSK